jgi:hypothetical protein
MKAEFEALLENYDSLLQAKGVDVRSWSEIFESRLDDAAARSGLHKEILREAIRKKYLPWIRANKKPSALPPRA